jgi:predicted PurR-regulated permease PerM
MLKLFQEDHRVSVSPSIVVFSILFLVFLYFLYAIRSILALFFLGFIVMVALSPFVHKLELKLRMPRMIAIIFTYILLILGFVGIIVMVIPPLTSQLFSFVEALNLPWLQDELMSLSLSLTDVGTIVEQLGQSVNTVYALVASTFSGVFTVLTIIVISLYLMVDRKRLHLRVVWFTKKKKHLETAKQFIDSLEHQLGGWIRGQLILMMVIGIVTYIGLSLLSVPYAAPLALLAASLEILPNLGPTLAAIPAIGFSLAMGGPTMGLVVLLFYLLVQQFENNLLVPKIMKDNVDVSPLISIMSILIGLKLAGFLGALLAIPLYIVLRSIYSTWFRDLTLS